jgi:hypothetical protein
MRRERVIQPWLLVEVIREIGNRGEHKGQVYDQALERLPFSGKAMGKAMVIAFRS